MILTRYPYTTIRRINYVYTQPRWEVTVTQDPDDDPHQSVRGEFLRWTDAVQLANEIAVAAGVRIPVKRARYSNGIELRGDQS